MLFKVFIAILILTIPHNNAFAENMIEQLIEEPEVVGKSRFRYMIFDLYDATLYAPNAEWDQNKPYALSLNYLRPLSGKKIATKSAEEIRRMGFTNEVKLAAWYAQMKMIFPDVKKGTILTGMHIPGKETQFYHGEKQIGIIKDPSFGPWFFGIWLSNGTSDPSLRTSLIGEK